MTARKAPSRLSEQGMVRGGLDLFHESDLAKLHDVAGMTEADLLLSPDKMVWRLRDAFLDATTFGAILNAEPPPAEKRDYLRRIAVHAEALRWSPKTGQVVKRESGP